jgi:hypothetical protein
MARGSGLALKATQGILTATEFCCAAVILAIFTYFVATLHGHGLGIDNYVRSVEGIAGAAVLYTVCGLLLLWCLAGLTLFAALALLIDLAFVGAFVYVAYQTRGGAGSCAGYVDTPLGSGDADASDHPAPAPYDGLPSLKRACRLETACFAVSIVALYVPFHSPFLHLSYPLLTPPHRSISFLLSAALEIALWRHHRAERAFGPSPTNNYTAGTMSRRRHFWRPRSRRAGALEKPPPDSLPAHVTPADVRNSSYTENSAVAAEPLPSSAEEGKYAYDAAGASGGYGVPARAHEGAPGYGYEHGYQTGGVTDATNY